MGGMIVDDATSRGFGEERGPRILRCMVWEVSARERMEEGESAWWNTRYCVISTERDSIHNACRPVCSLMK